MVLFRRRRNRWDEQWAVFPGELEGRPAMYFVDLGAVDAAPLSDLPTRLDVSVRLPDAGDSGMPAEHELPAVQALEDELTRVIGKKYAGVYVGRLLTAGTGRLTCYLPRPPEQPLALNSGLPVEVSTAADPAWEYLRDVLAPDEQQRHVIGDLGVVQALVHEGDRLDTPRPVDHTAFFLSEDDAEAAATELRAQGFDVKIEQDEMEYLLEAVRVDPVAPPELHELTWSVRSSVEAHGGSYDGWSCYVVR
jgi:Regulator of ribonuclease activity B/Family of unknown function (DUF695)